MNQYHKIYNVFKRDDSHKILDGHWTCSEFEYLQFNLWLWTEKVDGMNIRIIWDGNILSFRGKTDKAILPLDLMKRLKELFASQIELFKECFPNGCCFYGEGYGAGIQKSGTLYNPKGKDFVLFDIAIGEGNVWLDRSSLVDLADKFGIKSIPLVGVGPLNEAIHLVQQGIQSAWGGFEAEGLVVRPQVEMRNVYGSRIIAKIKAVDFKAKEVHSDSLH